jgi:DNA invertase Pin-like site-specific DNA recombinase
MKAAFSYIRFSSPEQARGDSFRRQSEKAAEWATRHGFTIVRSWSDLGVSSYRGRNARSGSFGEFLRAAEASELPKDSVLLVENLDRVSRQTPRKALELFLRVIGLGVGIVTLTDGELYTAESLDADPTGMKLFASLMVMIRANAESRLKGERVAAAWSRKRVAAREKSVPLSDRIPGWLDSVRDAAGRRTFTPNDVRDETVRRIFEETAKVFGRRRIVKGLNRDEKLSFLSMSGWQPSSVIKIIRSRTVLGEYQPHRRDDNGRRIPDGDVIKGYYPAVIDEALWIEANEAVKVRRTNSAGRPQAEVANLVRGLARCGCGARMLFLNKGAPPKGGRYFVCSVAARDAGCDNRRLWPAKDVERWLVHHLDPAGIAVAFEPAAKCPERSHKSYDLELAELTAMKDSAIDAALRNAGNALGPELERRAASLVEEIKGLRKRRDQAAAAERSKPHLPTTRSAIETVAALAVKLGTSNAEEKVSIRTALVQQLRTAFAEIVFSAHSIMGLIELPEKPKRMKGAFGIPKPITVRTAADKVERFFYRHAIFTDPPEVMAGFDGGKGYLHSRFHVILEAENASNNGKSLGGHPRGAARIHRAKLEEALRRRGLGAPPEYHRPTDCPTACTFTSPRSPLKRLPSSSRAAEATIRHLPSASTGRPRSSNPSCAGATSR